MAIPGKNGRSDCSPLEFWLHLWGNAKGVHENLAVRRIYFIASSVRSVR
jgi:hypothetical protein